MSKVRVVDEIGDIVTAAFYGEGDTINIQLQFSHAITVTGNPQITLETGTDDLVADYVSGTGSTDAVVAKSSVSNILLFKATVGSTHNHHDANYHGTDALSSHEGNTTFEDSDNLKVPVIYDLPTVATAGSISAESTIIIGSTEYVF